MVGAGRRHTRDASARALPGLLKTTGEAKSCHFRNERAQSALPLQSKAEEKGVGRGKVRLSRSHPHLLPLSPQTAATDPSTLVAAAPCRPVSSCAWRRLLFAEPEAQCRAPSCRTKSLQNFRLFFL